MKAGFNINRRRVSQTGGSTLEMLIALAVLVITLTAVTVVSFGNQSLSLDSKIAAPAQILAESELSVARAIAHYRFSLASTVATNSISQYPYTRSLLVTDYSPCLRQVESLFTWLAGGRLGKTRIVTLFTDWRSAAYLGEDCDPAPPSRDWKTPNTLGAANFFGKPLSLDALDSLVYVGLDESPYLRIIDARSINLDSPPPSDPVVIPYVNSFDAVLPVNDLDVARRPDGRTYAYLARRGPSRQLAVVDVTDPASPVLTASSSLPGVAGAEPYGWRIFYYRDRVYVTVRRTAGPELHIFNVSNPSSPIALGARELNTSVYDLVVTRARNQFGEERLIAYLATTDNSTGGTATLAELGVLDVTNPGDVKILYGLDLPGDHDGQSLYLLGSKLYVGRESSPGDDLYVYDVGNPLAGSGSLPLLTSVDVGAGVTSIRASDPFVFLGTTKAGQEFQSWRSDTSPLSNVSRFKSSGLVSGGLEYEHDLIYTIGAIGDSLKVIR